LLYIARKVASVPKFTQTTHFCVHKLTNIHPTHAAYVCAWDNTGHNVTGGTLKIHSSRPIVANVTVGVAGLC